MKRTLLIALAGVLMFTDPAWSQYPYTPRGVSNPQAVVSFWYRRYLHRNPDAGAAGWANMLRGGQSPQAVLSAILASDEYYLAAGGTPPSLVRTLFFDLVGREPTPQEFNYWGRRLQYQRRSDVVYQLLLRHPQTWPGSEGEFYYPDPNNGTFPDPSGPYFRGSGGPYYRGYEFQRPIRAFPLGSSG
jgi:hypothetical protein